MVTNKLFNVLVLGALTLGGCGPAQKVPGTDDPSGNTGETADASDTSDAGETLADASSPTPDAGSVETTDAGDEGGGVCPWAGMDPCPC